MSKESLEKLNQSLLKHFEETGVTNAFYYAPVDDHYWNKRENAKRIAFCNLEPYKKDEKTPLNGYELLSKEILYDNWFYTNTPGRIFLFNYFLSKALYNDEENTPEELGDIFRKIKKSEEIDNLLWEDFDNSLYFNFRYTCNETGSTNADIPYIVNQYKDPFYCQFYRDFVKEAQIDVLVIGSKDGCNLINKIYPELHLEYKGKPVKFQNTIFISTEHPSRISYDDMLNNIEMIYEAVHHNNYITITVC